MIRGTKGIVLLGGIVLLAAALFASSLVRASSHAASDAYAATNPMPLSPSGLTHEVKIGIVLGQGQVEGAEWAAAAQGAAVARYRLALGGWKIALLIEDDRGTADGGVEAVEALVERGVSGIVIASSGPHISEAAARASRVEVPTVLPYEAARHGVDEPTGVWSMAPDPEEVSAVMSSALRAFAHPVLLETSEEPAIRFDVPERIRAGDGDLERLARSAARRTEAGASAHGVYLGAEGEDRKRRAAEGRQPQPACADALVLDGEPQEMAALVAELEARDVTVPILLAPSAVSPAFAQVLGAIRGAITPRFRTFGNAADDPTALDSSAHGRAMSAYLQSVRELAGTPGATNLSGDASFADAAPWVDARSHDAIVMLVAGVARAKSSEPQKVRSALRGLHLTAGDGLAGPDIDLSRVHAVSAPVRALYATGQPLGLRPPDPDGRSLSWFPEPPAGSPAELEPTRREGASDANSHRR